MPVLSPRRSSSSALNGSYRNTFSTSNLDRPYYSSNSYNPRINSYSERYTARSYVDSDGRRIFSRQGSITEDGVTTRFKEEVREPSLLRDSASWNDSVREGSILEPLPSRYDRENSLTRSVSRDTSSSSRPPLSSINVAESVAELHKKYSPANYVPACRRKNDIISRSKSINDIGKPPIIEPVENKKVISNGVNCNNGFSVYNCTNNKECDNGPLEEEDDNGNRASVAEICKKFDQKLVTSGDEKEVQINGTKTIPENVKISENKFKKLDNEECTTKPKKPEGKITKSKKNDANALLVVNGTKKLVSKKKQLPDTSDSSKIDSSRCLSENASKSKLGGVSDVVNDDGVELRGGRSEIDVEIVSEAALPKKDEKEPGEEVESEGSRNSRTSNFASYIPSEEFLQGDAAKDSACSQDDSTNDMMDDRHILSENNRYILRNENSGSLERHHRGVGGGRDHIDGYGRPSPLPHLSSLGSAASARNTGLNGLKNIGNTCFMNSVLQCLSNTRPLLEYVKNDAYLNDINTTISGMKGALIKAFAHVIKELWSEDSSDRVVNTLALKSQIQRFAPRFMGYAQQDAQEFLRYLLEGLHEDVNRVTAKPKPIHTEIHETLSDSEKSAESWRRYLRMDNSKIVDIFVGQLKSTLRCTHCGHCSVTFDPFWDLSLPIPQRAGPLRLQQCLECFTREETLDGDEKPTCSKCKERRKCTKSFSIQKFPKILVIHLKRFSPTERYRGKLSLTIDFPIEGLDMQNYAADGSNGECRYNLYAISNHSGTTYSGHYTAYCRHPYTQSWHEYNDSRVSSISSKSLVSGEAYVLFYELESQKSHL